MDQRSGGAFESKARPRLAAATALLVGALCLVPSVAMANPTVAISPDKGPVGTSVTVSGSGFGAHSLVTVNLGGSTLADVGTDASGAFSVGIVVPQVGNGAHDIVVTSTAGTASARFVVQGPEPTTTTEPTTTSSPTTSTTTTTTTTTTTAPGSTTTAPSPTTTTAPGPTTTTAPSPTTTTSPTTTSATAPGSSPPTTTSAPTTGGSSGPSPTSPRPSETDPDPRDPTTSNAGSSPDDADAPPATTSRSTTQEDPDTEPDPTEETTTSTTVTRVTSELTLPFTSLRAWGGEDDPPELTGERVAVGDFSLTPAEGYAGATLELSFRFNRAIPGLTSVRVLMDDTALGDQIPVEDARFSVRRTVPDLPPDTYEVTVLSGDLLLTTAEFTVLEPAESATGSAPVVVLGVLALAAGLGWHATRNFQDSRSSPGTPKLIDTWYAWRERRRR